jgi:plastocyanin
MKSRQSSIMIGAALALALAFPTTGRADDKDKDKKTAKTWVVQFGQPQPQTPDPNPVGASVTHFLVPNDFTINKGDTVIFLANGGGHGIAIHPVSKNTTRDHIAADLCQGPAGTDESDRRARFTTCNATIGTQNLAYQITDGKDDLVIDVPQNVNANNPRVDDPVHTHQLVATSGRSSARACEQGEKEPACDSSAAARGLAGAFLGGSAGATGVGNQIAVVFRKSGRYLVICMNRGHSLNDHMFGFVDVAGDDDDDEK